MYFISDRFAHVHLSAVLISCKLPVLNVQLNTDVCSSTLLKTSSFSNDLRKRKALKNIYEWIEWR